ncbi:hypothetical protein PGB90_008408 [Kerria lacca]
MIIVYNDNITKCSIPCEFLYGGCKHNVEHVFAPVLNIKHTESSTRHNSQQIFVPSPRGKLPRCAKPGLTFCEKIERYPLNLIKSLAAEVSYNFKTLFVDESAGNKCVAIDLCLFRSGILKQFKKEYTKLKEPQSYMPTRFNNEPQFPISNAQIHIGINYANEFNQSEKGFNVYPDRRYPFDESTAHFVDPVLYASFSDVNVYNPNVWWQRNERYGRKTGDKRKRRQTSTTIAGTELCPTRSQFIMPRAALNNRGEWKYIVNVDQNSEKYTQLVRSETCLTTECNGICSLPNGYTSRCEQKYVQKRLVALEGTGTQLYTDIFWFPHCCICQIAPDIR